MAAIVGGMWKRQRHMPVGNISRGEGEGRAGDVLVSPLDVQSVVANLGNLVADGVVVVGHFLQTKLRLGISTRS